MNSIVLDDGTEYLIIDSIEIEGNKYTLFSNVNDPTDFCFRKTVLKDGKEVYSALSGKEEFEKILVKFGLKYEN